MLFQLVVVSVPELSPEQTSSMADRPFLSLLSALLWVARCTRPDLMVSLVILARACTRPNPSHWRALLRVLRYAYNTSHRHMIIHPGRTTASRITAIYDLKFLSNTILQLHTTCFPLLTTLRRNVSLVTAVTTAGTLNGESEWCEWTTVGQTKLQLYY